MAGRQRLRSRAESLPRRLPEDRRDDCPHRSYSPHPAQKGPDGSDVPGWWPHQLSSRRPRPRLPRRGPPGSAVGRTAGHKGLRGRLGPAAGAEVPVACWRQRSGCWGRRGRRVSAVDIEPASDDVPEPRLEMDQRRASGWPRPREPGRSRSAPSGLALAAVAGCRSGVADAVMDRLVVPVPGEDTLAPFLSPGCPGNHGVSSRGTWRSPTA